MADKPPRGQALITSITPDHGQVGDMVTIVGKYLFPFTFIKFNGCDATEVTPSGEDENTTITCRVPDVGGAENPACVIKTPLKGEASMLWPIG